MSSLFSNTGEQQLALSQKEAAAAQLRQLAALAKDQAATDQAGASSGSRTSGRRLLTFIGAGSGTSTLG